MGKRPFTADYSNSSSKKVSSRVKPPSMLEMHVVMIHNLTYSRLILEEYHVYTCIYICRSTEEKKTTNRKHFIKYKLLLPSQSVLEPEDVIVDCFYTKTN